MVRPCRLCELFRPQPPTITCVETRTFEDVAIYELVLLRPLTEASLKSFSCLGVDRELARRDLPSGRLGAIRCLRGSGGSSGY